MGTVQPPGVYQGAANAIAAVMLLIEFGMLRQALAGTRSGCIWRSPH